MSSSLSLIGIRKLNGIVFKHHLVDELNTEAGV